MSEDRYYAVRLLWVRDDVEAFESDPDFKKASTLRDTGAKLITVTARSGLA